MTSRTITGRPIAKTIINDRSLAIIGLTFAVWCILVLSEVEYVAATKIVFIVAAQTFAGSVFYLAIGRWRPRPLPELLGIGFAVGSMLSVIADQLFRTSNFRGVVWMLPLFGAVICSLIHMSKGGVDSKVYENGHAIHEFRTVLGIAVFSVIALTTFWNWMKFPAIGTLPILVYLFASSTWPRFSRSRYLVIAGFTSTCALGIYAAVSRPQYWWLPSWGIDENEIFANSIYNWGPNNDALTAGIPLKYQWTTHAWMGLVTHISGAGDFVLVSRASFVITAVAIVCLVWALAFRLTESTRLALLVTFVVCVSSTAISYPAAYSLLGLGSSFFALICILSLFVTFLDWYKTQSTLFLVLLIFLAISAIASKSVQILAIGSGIAAVGLYNVWLTRKFRILIGVLVIGVAIFVYAIQTFPSTNGTGLTRSIFASFTSQFGIDPYSRSFKARLLVTSIILVSLLGVSLIGAIGILRDRMNRHVGVFLIGIFVTGIPIAVLTTRVASTQMHFIQVPIMLGIVPAVSWLASHFFELRTFWGKYRKVLWAFLGVSFFAYPVALIGRTTLTSGLVDDSQFALFTNKVTATVFAFTFLIGACVYLVCRLTSRQRFPIELFVTACLVASSVSMFFTSWATNPILNIYETGATYQLGQRDLQDATSWAQRNTNINAIFASNSFFGENVDDRCGESSNALRGLVTDEATKTNYYTTALTLKRRLIAAGVSYGFLQGGDLTERVRLSILFACDPDAQSLRGLQDLSVTWFLAYRNMIDPTIWSNVGKVRFSNDRYAVIELNRLS